MSDADGLLSVTGDIPQGSGSCAAKFVLLGRKPAADITDQKNSSLCPFLSFFLSFLCDYSVRFRMFFSIPDNI